MDEYTISRKELVRLAKKCVQDSNLDNTATGLALIGTSVTMDEVLLSGWHASECGCLVGTLFADRFEDGENIDNINAEFPGVTGVGLHFDRAVKKHLREKYGLDDDVELDNQEIIPVR